MGYDLSFSPVGTQPGLDSQRLTMPDTPNTEAAMSAYQPSFAPVQSPVRPGATPTPGWSSVASPIMSGLQAGQASGGADDTYGAIAQTGMAGLAGAASGALTGAAIGAMGGPIGAGAGALIGGSVALLSTGLNSWLSLRSRNKERDRQEKLAKAIEERNQKIAAQQRYDYLSAVGYDRKKAALAAQAQAYQETSQNLWNIVGQNQNLKNMWVKQGFV